MKKLVLTLLTMAIGGFAGTLVYSKLTVCPKTTVTAAAITMPATAPGIAAVAKTAAASALKTVDTQPTITSGPLADLNIKKLIKVTSADGLQPKALKAALNSYAWAEEHGKLGSNTDTLTVVDFSLPSYQKRMWVIDLKNDKVLMTLYTTHGKNSGEQYATRFSNRENSDTSSLGLYVTSDEYIGRHDKSMHIDGLEQGINSNARDRSIVIHSADYATPAYIKEHHGAGRSWGCFAVAPAVKEQLLAYIKGGSVLFTYAAPEDKDPIIKNGPISI